MVLTEESCIPYHPCIVYLPTFSGVYGKCR